MIWPMRNIYNIILLRDILNLMSREAFPPDLQLRDLFFSRLTPVSMHHVYSRTSISLLISFEKGDLEATNHENVFIPCR